MPGLKLVVLLLLTASLLSCGEQSPQTLSIEEQESINRGQALFENECSECHPRSGRGDYLKRIPVTLLTRRSDQELMKWIEGSDRHREMPNFTDLSTQEKKDLANYLLSQLPQPPQ